MTIVRPILAYLVSTLASPSVFRPGVDPLTRYWLHATLSSCGLLPLSGVSTIASHGYNLVLTGVSTRLPTRRCDSTGLHHPSVI